MPTVTEIIVQAITELQKTETLSPRLDAEVLLAAVLGLDRATVVAFPERSLAPEEERSFRQLVERRGDGWPVAYLTGVREFMSLEFMVSPAVLIPRPETELLVEEILQREIPAHEQGLDLGTGSGCIAVSLAAQGGFSVVAVDRDQAALELARQNAARHGVAKKVRMVAGDWAAPLRGPFAWLACNPPYLRDDEYPGLASGVKREPRAALLGGTDGLDYYRRLIRAVPRLLAVGGRGYCELGTSAAAAERLFRDAALIGEVTVIPDLAGWPRVLVFERR